MHNRYCFLWKFSSESEITANGGDEVSGAPETANTARDALFPHQPLTTDNNTPINQQHSSSTNLQPNHEEDLSSSQDTEEPKMRPSSEDHESTAEPFLEEAVLREIEPDGRDVFICTHKTSAALCFQNSLCSELD